MKRKYPYREHLYKDKYIVNTDGQIRHYKKDTFITPKSGIVTLYFEDSASNLIKTPCRLNKIVAECFDDLIGSTEFRTPTYLLDTVRINNMVMFDTAEHLWPVKQSEEGTEGNKEEVEKHYRYLINIDRDRNNNRVDNLVWSNRKFSTNVLLTTDCGRPMIFNTIDSAFKALHVHPTDIHKMLSANKIHKDLMSLDAYWQ